MHESSSEIIRAKEALASLNHDRTIIVIGRANSGTRILPEAMQGEGIYFGEPQNIASDLLPSQPMYAACRVLGPNVDFVKKHEWDFTKVMDMQIPDAFFLLLAEYLESLLVDPDRFQGFKIPNSNLIYPWLIRIFPNARFIHWIRHPEGACRKMSGVDRLEKWNVPCKKFLIHEWNYRIRIVSWKYHFDIVDQVPQPLNFLRVRYEDYVLEQERTKKTVEDFIQHPMAMLDLVKAKAGPYTQALERKYPLIHSAMKKLGYLER